ncbi:Cyclic di-GMP binding protein precursor [hydrothermal vent metagenome]|uniref:Cyclic di-GMP binding protein n=1 Tax=hydrothermal vent metagenome TaxID=652676 RepID=A0A1W1D4X0_9ZZZZ
MLRFFVLLLMMVSFLYGAQKQKVIHIKHLQDGSMLVRVALNYANPRELSRRLRGSDGIMDIHLPIPGNWKVLSAQGYLSYSPSVLLLKDHSSGVITFNNVNIKQFKLFKYMNVGVKFKINPKYIKDYNDLRIEIIQHYTDKCENNSNSQLWTDINLVDSYIEYHIIKTPIPEEIQSLTTHMIDSKQYELEPLNYVVSKNPNDEELRYYALLTGAAANAIKYRMAPISVSHQIDLKKHNILITTKKEAKKELSILRYKYLFEYDPLFALKFNNEKYEPITAQNIEVQPSQFGLKITKKNALAFKSVYFNKGKIAISHLPIEDKKSVTVSFWFKSDDTTQNAILFGFENYALVLDKNKIGFQTNQRDLYGARVRNIGKKWHHIVAVFDAHNIHRNSIYLDGKRLILKQLKKRTIASTFSSFAFIGGRLIDDLRNFKGYIDQFYFFDEKLPSLFIKKMYKLAKKYKKQNYDESLFIGEKILYDVNVLRNPYLPQKAILVIAPKEKKDIENVLYGLYKKDLSFYFRQGLNITQTKIPPKAKAYSAKNYIPVDTKIYFSDLGYKTQVLKGWYPPSIAIKFNVYPDHHFGDKERIKTYLNYVFPSTVNEDSVANMFLNGKFAQQIKIMDAVSSESLSLKTGGLFDTKHQQKLPAFLLDKGHNTLKFEFSLVPKSSGYCSVTNSENLLVMIMDDSYFILPQSKRWIEMPYMQYIHSSAYPYSIYPDLQDTQLVLANNDTQTIASAMNFVFFLAQEIQGFPFYINITQNPKHIQKEKQLIFFGTISDSLLQKISQNGPIPFSKSKIEKAYPFVHRFVTQKSIVDDDRLKKYRFLMKVKETNELDTNLLVEMFQSPYDDEKTVLMFVAQTPQLLNKSVKSLLAFENRHFFNGDALIYNADMEEGVSFDIKKKYVLSSMNWLDTMSLLIGMDPWFYLSFLVITLIMIGWIAKVLLKDFKKRIHKHVE